MSYVDLFKILYFIFLFFFLIRTGRFLSMKFSKSGFQFWSKMSNKSLYWPSGSISQSTNSVTFDLLGQLPQEINLFWPCVTLNCKKKHFFFMCIKVWVAFFVTYQISTSQYSSSRNLLGKVYTARMTRVYRKGLIWQQLLPHLSVCSLQ